MARVKGDTTPLLTLKIGAGSALDFGPEVVGVELTDGEGNPVTMSDYATGDVPKALTVEYVLDFGTAKSWEFHNTNSGAANTTIVFQHTTGTPSADNPKFTWTPSKMPNKPNFEISAGTDTSTYEVTYELGAQTIADS